MYEYQGSTVVAFFIIEILAFLINKISLYNKYDYDVFIVKISADLYIFGNKQKSSNTKTSVVQFNLMV